MNVFWELNGRKLCNVYLMSRNCDLPVVIWRFALGISVLGFTTLRGNRSVRLEPLPARRIQAIATNQLPRRPVSTHEAKNIPLNYANLDAPVPKGFNKRVMFFYSLNSNESFSLNELFNGVKLFGPKEITVAKKRNKNNNKLYLGLLNCSTDCRYCYHRFGMMTCCWLPNPEERPSSAQVLACLQDFQKTLNQFI